MCPKISESPNKVARIPLKKVRFLLYISSIGSIRAGLWHAKEKPYYSCPTPPTDVVRASCLDETTMAWGHVIESRKM